MDLESKTIEERRAYWADKLESGDYKQDFFQLKSPRGLCCLGVACDLYNPNNWVSEEISGSYAYSVDDVIKAKMPPDKVLEFFGITHEEANKLARENDDGADFSTIAGMIRANTGT